MEASFLASRVSRQGGLMNCQCLHVTGKLSQPGCNACMFTLSNKRLMPFKGGKGKFSIKMVSTNICKNLRRILMITLCFNLLLFNLQGICATQRMRMSDHFIPFRRELGYLRLYELTGETRLSEVRLCLPGSRLAEFPGCPCKR